MSNDILTLIWLIGGILLLVSEIWLPGVVAIFVGAAAMIVAGLRWAGLIEGLSASLFAWMGLSIGFTALLRGTIMKRLPGETRRALTEENIQAVGTVVTVLEAVNDENTNGRIRYQGTTWPATTIHGQIPSGGQAKLVARQNLAWVVEPVDSKGE